MTFEEWINEVNGIFVAKVGMDYESWPDQAYWDLWNSDVEPEEMVAIAVHNEYGDDALEAFGLEAWIGEL